MIAAVIVTIISHLRRFGAESTLQLKTENLSMKYLLIARIAGNCQTPHVPGIHPVTAWHAPVFRRNPVFYPRRCVYCKCPFLEIPGGN